MSSRTAGYNTLDQSKKVQFNPLAALRIVKNFGLKSDLTRRDIQATLLQFAYHSAISPIYQYGDEFRLHSSKRGLLPWIFMLGLISFSAIVLIGTQLNTFIFHTFTITNIQDIVPLFFTSCLVSTWILHLHTALKRQEIVQLVNGYNQHCDYLAFSRRKS
jgi:hypothetical protein